MVESCKCEINDFSFPPNGQFIKKPWGGYIEHFRANDESVCFKTLIINPQAQISVQTHELRDEVWYIATEDVQYQMILENTRQSYFGKKRFDIPRTKIHSIKNLDDKSVLYIHEMQMGICKESDIVRLYDPYNRGKT